MTTVGYDATVDEAVDIAAANDWLLVQDTSFDGYEEIPLDIMQGKDYMCQTQLASYDSCGDACAYTCFRFVTFYCIPI